MSELEKRQRDEYQKNRRKWIWIQIIIAAVLVLATIGTFIPYTILNNNTYVYYAEDGKTNTKVYLKNNTFFDNETLDTDYAYVAELMNNIETEFKYALAMGSDSVDYKYSYKIDATVKVIDRDSKAPLYDPSFVLKEVTDAQSSESQLSISETISVNYDEYNQKAKDFVTEYGVSSATATLVVRMNVSVLGESETLAEDKNNSYSMEVSIPLLRQTLKVTSSSSVPQGEQKILAYDTVATTVLLVLWIVFLSLAALVGLFILVFVVFTRDKHIDYARKVQNLLSSYKSYIQRISNPFEFDGYKVLGVVTFEELLEIGDKLQNPVLMYENDDKTKSEFFVATSNNLVYLYVVEAGVKEDTENPEELKKPFARLSAVISSKLQSMILSSKKSAEEEAMETTGEIENPIVEEFAEEIAEEEAAEEAEVVDEEADEADEEAEIVDEEAEIVDEEAEIVDEEAEVVDEEAEVVDEEAEVVDEEAEIVDEEAEIVDEEAEIVDEEAEIVDEEAEVVDEEAEVVDEEAEVVDEEAEIVDEEAEIVDEEAEIVDEEAEVVDEEAEVVDEEAEVANEEAEIVDEEAEIVDEEAEVANEEAEVVDEEAEVVDEEAEIVDEEAEVVDEEADEADEAELATK